MTIVYLRYSLVLIASKIDSVRACGSLPLVDSAWRQQHRQAAAAAACLVVADAARHAPWQPILSAEIQENVIGTRSLHWHSWWNADSTLFPSGPLHFLCSRRQLVETHLAISSCYKTDRTSVPSRVRVCFWHGRLVSMRLMVMWFNNVIVFTFRVYA